MTPRPWPGSKAASFALYARIFFVAFSQAHVDWAPLLGIVAALTIVVGNWAAITQDNSKRLLAYSSISNAGYLLLGLIAYRAGRLHAVLGFPARTGYDLASGLGTLNGAAFVPELAKLAGG